MEDNLKAFRRAYLEISNFISRALSVINLDEVLQFVKILENAHREGKKVLVVGVGRSGLVARAFAMRLMHLGFRSYVLGETITPSVGEGDVFFPDYRRCGCNAFLFRAGYSSKA